jgi:hypothetical protein
MMTETAHSSQNKTPLKHCTEELNFSYKVQSTVSTLIAFITQQLFSGNENDYFSTDSFRSGAYVCIYVDSLSPSNYFGRTNVI